MNKSEFVAFLANQFQSSKTDAEKALNMVVKGIFEAVKQKKSINIVGFGSFSVKRREARDGRNPKTGAKMHIPAYNQPVFHAGKSLKDTCN